MSVSAEKSSGEDYALILINKKYWMGLFLIVAAISISGLIYLGRATYTGAPPDANFISSSGETVLSRQLVSRGEEVFHLRGLMTICPARSSQVLVWISRRTRAAIASLSKAVTARSFLISFS